MVNMPSCKQTNIYVHEIEINKSKSKSKCYTFLSDFWYINVEFSFQGIQTWSLWTSYDNDEENKWFYFILLSAYHNHHHTGSFV